MQDWIDRLGTLDTELVKRAAPELAKELQEETQDNIVRGVDPDGKPWLRTKDGAQPLRNAGKAVSTKAVGNVIIQRVEGVEAKHHKGAVKGGEKRPIIPSRKMPRAFSRACAKVFGKHFREILIDG